MMKYDSVHVRWFLYVSIAFLMSVYNELNNFKSLSEITNLKLFLICIFSSLQALIAWRAFIDQSLSRSAASSVPPISTPTPPVVAPTPIVRVTQNPES